MAIDTLCKGCGKTLRVGDEHAGQQARCPSCQAVYIVPQRSTVVSGAPNTVSAAPRTLADSWQMKTPDGLVYGPIAKADLDRWCEQGRMTPRCQVLQEGESQWHWASELYPQLATAQTMTAMTSGPLVNPYSPMALPLVSPTTVSSVHMQYPQSHRGGLILILAIVGYFSLCFGVSLIAVFLGLHDLRQMQSGQMDPEGRTLTLVGIVLASIWVVASVISLGYVFLIIFGWL